MIEKKYLPGAKHSTSIEPIVGRASDQESPQTGPTQHFQCAICPSSSHSRLLSNVPEMRLAGLLPSP